MRVTSIVFLLCFCCMDAQTQNQHIVAQAAVDSTNFLIGDGIRVRINFQHPKGSVIQAQFGDTLGGFAVLERLPSSSQTDTTSTATVTVARYETGEAILPPFPFAVNVPGDSAHHVSTNSLVVTIHAVAVDTTKDIRDLKPPLGIPLTPAEIMLLSGIVLAIAAAVYFGYRYWKKRKEKRSGKAVDPALQRPAHVIAFEELAILKEKRLWQQGRVKEFYSDVTGIFRQYLENRYAMKALEETTDEIMDGLRVLRFPDSLRENAGRILHRADLVKFAKYQPLVPEHEEMIAVVYGIVERTKITQMAPVHALEPKGAEHAGH